VGSGAEPRPKTNLVHSAAARKPLVANILSILTCLLYCSADQSKCSGSGKKIQKHLHAASNL